MADRGEQEISLVPADRLRAAGPLATEVFSTQEISGPMLDVHPPHEAVRTWKDFSIHIAAIAVGLLIAIGLEQTVEYFHHRNQVAQTREALRIEREQNHLRLADQLAEFRVRVPIVQTNLAVFHYLRQHPDAAEKDLPGKLSWHNSGAQFIDLRLANGRADGSYIIHEPRRSPP
jgi:hypothetical protein